MFKIDTKTFPVLTEWLVKNGAAHLAGVHQIDDAEFHALLVEARRAHPTYSFEKQEAWALYTILRNRDAATKKQAKVVDFPAPPSAGVPAFSTPAPSPVIRNDDWRVWAWRIAVLLLLLLIAARPAFAQRGTSQIDVIFFDDSADVRIGSFAGPFTVKCGTNLTCTKTGAVIELVASGGGGAHNLLSATHSDTTTAGAVRGDGLFAVGATPTWQRVARPTVSGGYFKWNGTDIVASTLAASGTGTCTNQAVTALAADAAPTCTTITSAYTSGTFDPDAHAIDGAKHTAAGLTTGQPLRATGATTFAFGALDLSNSDAVANALAKINQHAATVYNDAGNTYSTGIQDFTSATSLLIPNSITPPGTCTVGSVYHDTNAAAGSRYLLCTALNTFTGIDNPFGSAIDDGELASNYSGVGSCTNQAVTAVNDNAVPTCATITSAYTSGTFAPDAHAASHESAGGDTVNHDSLTGFVADEHVAHTGVTLTAGAGLSGGGDISASRSFATASGEADFLASGALTCGASTQGKAQVHTTPLQYCDNAATPALQYAAYGASDGDALAGDSATAFFDAGNLELARLPVGGANQLLKTNAGATAQEHATLATGTAGTDFAVAFGAGTITLDLPAASATASGKITTGTQTIAGAKTFTSQPVVLSTGNFGYRAESTSDTSTTRPIVLLLRQRATGGGAVLANDLFGSFDAYGHDGTAIGLGYRVDIGATENWSGAAHGTNAKFHTITTGTTTLAERLRLNGGSEVQVSGLSIGTAMGGNRFLFAGTPSATRTWTLPDASSTFAGLSIAQTFTANQTLSTGNVAGTIFTLHSTVSSASWVPGTDFVGKLEITSADTSGPGAGLKGALHVHPTDAFGSSYYVDLLGNTSAANSVRFLRFNNGTLTLGDGTNEVQAQNDFAFQGSGTGNRFKLTGTPTAVRTWTLQDASDTFVGKATTDILTNKTLDVEGTGNVITTVADTVLPFATCSGASAALNWDDAGTGDTAPTAACNDTGSIQRPTANFSGSAVNSLELTFGLPDDWTGNIDLTIRYVSTAASPTGNVEFDVSTVCRAVGETWDGAFNSPQTITDAQAAQNVLNDATQTSLTTTGCAAGEDFTIKISRDGTNDSSNDLANALWAKLTIRRAQ